ncbi:hypothetical protein HID58_024896 [Brassica napus]|uniref:Protein EXORDIUM-like 5 n=1 Tax=Brassica napus TaxID=3708 RepID=A0ABQ8CJH0_BRANA|nr:hypothetical protein HID58_024896 [Brassica napus]
MSSPAINLFFALFSFLIFSVSSSLPQSQTKNPATVQTLNVPAAEIKMVNPKLPPRSLSLTSSKRYEGSSDLVHLRYHMGPHLTRLSIQEVIASAARSASFPVDHKNGMYLVLTSHDVTMQDFCRAVCGFHYFTFPSMVGYTMPYAWVGQSGKQCPEVCAYPFALPGYMGHGGPGELRPPNGETGVDGMVSVIGHELAEVVSNPLINAWYAGEDPTAPTEIGDLCEGLYGTGGGGGYIGQVMQDRGGKTFNMNGKGGRKFLVQWIWNPNLKACSGPNSVD